MSDQPYTDAEREHVDLARMHFEGREVVCPRCRQGIGKPCRQVRRGYRELGPTRTYNSVEHNREHIGTHAERVALARMLD